MANYLVVLASVTAFILYRRAPSRYNPQQRAEGITSDLERMLPASYPRVAFEEVAEQSGINFQHFYLSRSTQLPEDMGSGAAWGDYDGDGREDLFIANVCGPLTLTPAEAASSPATSRLYRNLGDGAFADVTQQAGLDLRACAMAAAWGDFDSDARLDLVVTSYPDIFLYRNGGDGTFEDVSARLAGFKGFWTGASWGDYDRDGWIDLYVCGYVKYRLNSEDLNKVSIQFKAEVPYTLNPSSYEPERNLLFRNDGKGNFKEAARQAGVENASGRSLSASWCDFDDDGWIDLFVANDTQPNKLYRNKGDGAFSDEGVMAGVAFSETGTARAGMGVDAADYDGAGRQSLVIGNFSNEMMSLYHNEGAGLFIDEAPTSTIGRDSLLTLTFACFFFDYDLDGLVDIFAANGHVSDDISAVQPRVKYAQPPHLFRNLGRKKFQDMASKTGSALQQPMVARGAAFGDYDNDGDLDLLVTSNNGPARLLRNDGGNQNNLIRIRAAGTTSNRDGVCAKIKVTVAGQAKVFGMVKTGSSYASQSELALTFGLGKAEKAQSIEITWPNGNKQTLADVAANQEIVIEEGKGIVSSAPIVFSRP